MSDNCLSTFAEPNTVFYNVEDPHLAEANSRLKDLVPSASDQDQLQIIAKCREMGVRRLAAMNAAMDSIVCAGFHSLACFLIDGLFLG
jgi:hypothetical protein